MKFLEIIDSYRDDMVQALQDLLAFDSLVREGEDGTPFGTGLQQSLAYMLAMAERDDFTTLNVDNRCGHIELGQEQEIVGIFTHLDTTPAGEEWGYDPFGKDIADGRLYGRGTMDGKGPAIMIYFAMKALRAAAIEDETADETTEETADETTEETTEEQGFFLKKRVRLILGLDQKQETGKSIPYYLKKAEVPDLGFTPDSDFPLVFAERGILLFELAKKLTKPGKTAGLVLKSIKGGSAYHIVAEFCQAVLSGEQGYELIREKVQEFSARTGYPLTAKGRGRALEITATGISGQTIGSEEALSAISVMMAFLGELDLTGDEITDFIAFYNSKIGFDLHGAGGIGCDMEDKISGKLLFNVGLIDVGEEKASMTVCLHYPVTSHGEEVYDRMRDVIHAYNLGIVKIDDKKPVCFPPETKLVKTLLEVYQKHTGDTIHEPVVINETTYARAAKNIVAFGPFWPGEKKRSHRTDEYIEIDRLVQLTKIYAEAIFRLANE